MADEGRLVRGAAPKEVRIDSLIPDYGGNLFNIEPVKDRVRLNVADVRFVRSGGRESMVVWGGPRSGGVSGTEPRKSPTPPPAEGTASSGTTPPAPTAAKPSEPAALTHGEPGDPHVSADLLPVSVNQRPRLEGLGRDIEQRFDVVAPLQHHRQAPVVLAAGAGGHALDLRPEATRAILTCGKRDISFDLHLPVLEQWYRHGEHARPQPIPVYAEMGSINPIVVTEAALACPTVQGSETSRPKPEILPICTRARASIPTFCAHASTSFR